MHYHKETRSYKDCSLQHHSQSTQRLLPAKIWAIWYPTNESRTSRHISFFLTVKTAIKPTILPWFDHGSIIQLYMFRPRLDHGIVLPWYSCHTRWQLYHAAKTWYNHVDIRCVLWHVVCLYFSFVFGLLFSEAAVYANKDVYIVIAQM